MSHDPKTREDCNNPLGLNLPHNEGRGHAQAGEPHHDALKDEGDGLVDQQIEEDQHYSREDRVPIDRADEAHLAETPVREDTATDTRSGLTYASSWISPPVSDIAWGWGPRRRVGWRRHRGVCPATRIAL